MKSHHSRRAYHGDLTAKEYARATPPAAHPGPASGSLCCTNMRGDARPGYQGWGRGFVELDDAFEYLDVDPIGRLIRAHRAASHSLPHLHELAVEFFFTKRGG